MRISVDLEKGNVKVKKWAIVVISRGKKGRIIYNSKLIYFYHEKALHHFIKVLGSLEYVLVDVAQHHNFVEKGNGYWCPYCQQWEYWKATEGGYKKCPICGVSDSDYYVKTYNNIWGSRMGSKKEQIEKTKRRKKNANSNRNG